MKRKLMMLVAAIAVGTGAWAQDTPMVTLQNDTETKVFYGSDSFKDAMEVANHGDVVTLSSGIFNAPVITKAVAIFGAGGNVANDTIDTGLTQINGDMSIQIDSTATGFYLEGVFCSVNEVWVEKPLKSASFVKCRFNNINFNKNDSVHTMVNSEMVYFYQCRIAGWLEPGECNAMTVYNSVINNVGMNTESSSVIFQNSLLFYVYKDLMNARFENSYIYRLLLEPYEGAWHRGTSSSASNLSSTCSAFNSLADINYWSDMAVHTGCWSGTSLSFVEGSSSQYSDTDSYELTDASKADYIGTDGKPIGLYGGDYPYNTIPSVPYVVKKEIATKSENGKLKVSIKVAVPGSNL